MERGHTNVLEYDFELFTDMLKSSGNNKIMEDKNLAFIVRLGFSSEDINQKIDEMYQIGQKVTQKNINELMELQKEL